MYNIILKEMQFNNVEMKVYLFYALIYCVGFTGEHNKQFMEQKADVTTDPR